MPRQTSPAPAAAGAVAHEVIVTDVQAGSAVWRAGLRAGDVLLSYAGRPLATPFEFLAAVENCPGAANLKVRRGVYTIEVALRRGLPPSQGRVVIRPEMPATILSLYQAGLKEYIAANHEAAILKWQAANAAAEAANENASAAWLCGQIANAYQEMAKPISSPSNAREMQARTEYVTQAQIWLERVWNYVKKGEDKAAQALLGMLLGKGRLNMMELEAALPYYEQAYTFAERNGNEVWAAADRQWQALILMSRYVPSAPNYRSALTFSQRITKANDLAQARRWCEESLEVRKRRLPNSPELAESYNYVASVFMLDFDLAKAQTRCEQATAIYRRLDWKSLNPAQMDAMAQTFAQAGIIAMLRGDCINAIQCYRDAIASSQGNDTSTRIRRSDEFSNLASVYAMAGDMEQARHYAQRAVDTCPRFGFGWQEQRIQALITRGLLAAAQRDFVTARQDCSQALAMRREDDNTKPVVSEEERAVLLNTLGIVAVSENQAARARQCYQQALDIWRIARPISMGMALSLNGMGMIAAAEGDIKEAEAKFQAALTVIQAFPSTAFQEPTIGANLGRVYLRQHLPEKALPLLKDAASTLETRRQRIADLDSRALFMQQYASPFADLIETYLMLPTPDPDQAFAMLERLHARAFADNLAEWRIQLDQKLPPGLQTRKQRLDNVRRIREKDIQRAVMQGDKSAAEEAQREMEKCEAQQRQLETDIRRDYVQRSGHDIAYPVPIDRAAAQRCLPEGVLALAYAVNEDSAYVFALTRSTYRVYTLPLAQKALTQRVKAARDLLTDIHSAPASVERALLDLYRDLLRPVQPELDKAHSIVICPDDALHRLPFAALMPRRGHYLIQDKPVTTTASLTVYCSLRSQPRPALTSLLALGDPAYSLSAPTGGGQGAWKRLPETGTLAKQIKTLYAPRSRTLLKEQATARDFLAHCGEASILHFGCHAVTDDRNPFGSWLALTPAAGQQEGPLAAWQILHQRLNARLVVLWACGSGLGTENRYEGILGLPRAFETAGAANVLTTLWEVHPKETSALLFDFYRLCKPQRGGASLAFALRQAQINAIQSKTNAGPYYWAAFSLDGVGE